MSVEKNKELNIIQNLNKSGVSNITEGYSFLKGSKLNSLKILNDHGLPGVKSEEYKYFPAHRKITDSLKLFQARRNEYESNVIQDNLINDPIGNHLVFIDGIFSETHSNMHSSSDIQISIINEFDKIGTELSFDGFKASGSSKDPYELLNLSYLHNLALIRISDNTPSAHIFCYYFYSADLNNELLNSQIQINIGNNSSCNLTEIYMSDSESFYFDNFSSRIHVGKNSKLNLSIMQEFGNDSLHIHNTNIYQDTGSTAKTNTVSLKGGLLRNNLVFHLTGSHCESYLDGLYFVSGKNIIDNHTIVDHLKPDTYSNEFYKGIIDDRGKGVFNGKIFVRPDAQKTNAFQSNKNIVLTDTASINTKPQLEIWADDVKCSHGATTGQMDDEQLFYLRSRGLGKEKAKALLLHAFANEIIEKIDIEELRIKIEQKINNRLGYTL